MGFPLVVLDASAALALLLADEEGKSVEDILIETISLNGQIFVPELFWYELGNGMITAGKRGKVSQADSEKANSYLSQLPIITYACSDPQVRQHILALSREHDLSYYDASYLELAMRFQAPLKTFDKHLLKLKKSISLIA
ncbi:MAG: type II toxin-antitoxin system VapC family toxin [Spirochaetales bacterium]|jgi:predicted nucleic acid-binding protein|nr:type II toxin-antitoxin system VapC family toxin [Spirochaetales bacterium]